ncbi:MAG TPA: 3'-5' exonuclease [Terriglobia bacterium]|nr:3'-5' exonuclease [Terriglobia bacterium]
MVEGTVTEPPFVGLYHKRFEESSRDNAAIDTVRFVVLDCETTGLNPRTDRIITIGAVGVLGGEIVIEDSFEALVKMTRNSESVTVHGVTRDESRDGLSESDAIERFIEYLQDGVVVGHHIGHDVAMLDGSCERHWGFHLRNRCVETMYLALHLQAAGAFPNHRPSQHFTLDALCERFGVEPHGRHTAAGDAFLTAQVFLRLSALAKRFRRDKLGALCEPFPAETR